MEARHGLISPRRKGMKMKFFTVLLICFMPVFGASAVVDGPDPIILDDVECLLTSCSINSLTCQNLYGADAYCSDGKTDNCLAGTCAIPKKTVPTCVEQTACGMWSGSGSYESRICNVSDVGNVCGVTDSYTEYRCAEGYYGSETNCTSCPVVCGIQSTSSAGTTSRTGCCVTSSDSGSDLKGDYYPAGTTCAS